MPNIMINLPRLSPSSQQPWWEAFFLSFFVFCGDFRVCSGVLGSSLSSSLVIVDLFFLIPLATAALLCWVFVPPCPLYIVTIYHVIISSIHTMHFPNFSFFNILCPSYLFVTNLSVPFSMQTPCLFPYRIPISFTLCYGLAELTTPKQNGTRPRKFRFLKKTRTGEQQLGN